MRLSFFKSVLLLIFALLPGVWAWGGARLDAAAGQPAADAKAGKALGAGDGLIRIVPALSAPSVKNGGKLTIQAVVKARAGVARVEAEIEGVTRLELKPAGQEAPGAVGLYQAQWTANGLAEKVYPVALRVTDRRGHVFVDRSLSFSDPAAGNSTPGNAAYPGGATPRRVGALDLNPIETRLCSAVIDPARQFAYFGTFTSPGGIIQIRLSDFTRVRSLWLNPGEDNLSCAVMDPAGKFAYFGCCGHDGSDFLPGRVVRIRLSDFKRVDALTLNADDKGLGFGVIDPSGSYAYFGTVTTPMKVIKINLVSFSRVGALAPDNTGRGMIKCAAIDPAGGYAYFGATYYGLSPSLLPGKVLKVRLSDLKCVGELTLNSDEKLLQSAVIDASGGYAYFGTAQDLNTTASAHIVKVRLSDFTRIGSLTLGAGERYPKTAVIDSSGGFAWFGTSTDESFGFWRVVKVRLTDFTYANTGKLDDYDQNLRSAAVIDPVGGYVYYGADIYETSRVVKVRLADCSRVGALLLNDAEADFNSALIDMNAGYAYFATATDPGMIVKVRLSDFSYVDTLKLQSEDKGISCGVIDPAGEYAYYGTYHPNGAPGRVIKVRLSDFSRVGSLTLNAGETNLNCVIMDPTGEYAYFGTGTSPGMIVKVRLADLTRMGALTLNADENDLSCAVIDPTDGHAYFGASQTIPFATPGVVVKIRLSDFTRVGALKLDSREESLFCVVMDTVHGYIYFSVYDPVNEHNKIVKVRRSDFTRVATLTIPGADTLLSALIDPAGDFAFWGTGYGVVVKVRLSDFTLMTPGCATGDGPLTCAVMDPYHRYGYFGNGFTAGRVSKVALENNFSLRANRITLAERGRVNDVRFYSHAAQGNVRLALYSDTTTKTLLWESGVLPNTKTNGWLTVPVSAGWPTALNLNPGKYWLAWQSDSGGDVPSYAPGTAGEGFSVDQPFGPFPASLGAGQISSNSEKWSEYLTYDALKNAASGWGMYR